MLCLSWGTPAIYWERRTRRSSGDYSRRYMQLPELTSTRVFAKLLRREPSSRNARQRQPCLPVNAELAWSHWQHAEKRNTRRDAAFWSGKRLSTTTNHRSRILETAHLFIYNENRTKVHKENQTNERYIKRYTPKLWNTKHSRIQKAQLSPRDRAMRRVSWNLANCHATVQKPFVRQVLNRVSAVANWSVRQNHKIVL